jgi:acetylornithine deacetylase/succinyl-diaminopimelate desuccinylase-like protein
VVVIDSVWISKKTPCIYYALRGSVSGSMILETAKVDVHSGVTGGVAVNPIFELCRVAAQCYQPESGKVLIPGFYQGIVKPGKREWKHFLTSGFQLTPWAKSYGLKQLQVKNRKQAIERLWCRPTFEVLGLAGGYTGPGVKSAIPPRAEMKFNCRLAPNQDPEKIAKRIVSHIKRINPRIKVLFHSKLHPFLGSSSGPYSDAAVRAYHYGFSQKPVFARGGGSDGAIILLHQYLKAPILMMGLSLPEHGYHAPNEYFDWQQTVGGILTFVKFFEEASLP